MAVSRSSRSARRRLIVALSSLALAAGIMALPAAPAAAGVCKVNSTLNATESQIQTILDAAAPNSTVTFSGTCFGTFLVDENLKILGSGTAVVDGEDDGSVFTVADTVVASFTNLTITNGSNGDGSGLYVYPSAVVAVTRVRFDGGNSTYGGALFASPNSNVSITSSSFVNNVSIGVGGAIYVDGARVTISGSTFTGNQAANGAGAIFADHCSSSGSLLPLTISRSSFVRNGSALGPAGAIYVNSVPMTISSSTFTGNQSAGSGGAIEAIDVCGDDQPLSIAGTTFTGNVSGDLGGAIYIDNTGALTLRGSKFNGNAADSGGAIRALYLLGGMDIASSTFSGNVARDGYGGAIAGESMFHDGGLLLASSTFTGNRATAGGGAIGLYDGWSTGPVTITGTTFTRNTAGQSQWDGHDYGVRVGGGAIGLDNAPLLVSGSTFSSNTALGSGGAVFFEGDTNFCTEAVFSRTVMKGNVSSLGDGGGLYAVGTGSEEPGSCTDVTLEASTFTGNSAVNGGAVYVDGYEYHDGTSTAMDLSGTLWVDGATKIDGNRASGHGGGIAVEDWHLELQGSVSGNTAGDTGGGVHAYDGGHLSPSMRISNARIERNTATNAGGGVYVDGSGHLGLLVTDADGRVSISYNKVTSLAGRGGGLYVDDIDDLRFVSDWFLGGTDYTMTVAYNLAKDRGGGVFAQAVHDARFLDNGLIVTKNDYGGFDSICGYSGGATITGNVGYDAWC